MGTALINMPSLSSLSFLGLTLLALEGFASLVEGSAAAACHSGEVALVIVGICVCLLVTSSWLVI